MHVNGNSDNHCKAPEQLAILRELLEEQEIIRRHMEQQIKQNKIAYEWLVSYIERTMPIKSHYWILLGSLSILAAFASIIKYVDHLTK